MDVMEEISMTALTAAGYINKEIDVSWFTIFREGIYRKIRFTITGDVLIDTLHYICTVSLLFNKHEQYQVNNTSRIYFNDIYTTILK